VGVVTDPIDSERRDIIVLAVITTMTLLAIIGYSRGWWA